MKTKDFYYDLPDRLIAQHPLDNREQSNLMILDKKTGEITNKKFKDIINYLKKGDCLVLNDTRVIPARIFGNRVGKEERVEILLLKRNEQDRWECLVKPGKKARPGHTLEFGGGILKGEILSIEKEEGTRIIEFEYKGIFEEILDELGEMPLPPYITEKLDDGERYQTVYSKNIGSAAAPTAGLHFTKDLLEAIENKGINIVYLTLHVGLGTFRPVKAENILDHHMHSEYYELLEKDADIINITKEKGGKIISVGTTSTRTLETLASNGKVKAGSGWTDIFIYPGYSFKIVDNLITNFHLPESTLLMLVSAFSSKEIILNAYRQAVEEEYRFFSFGDAMFIK